MDRLWCIAQHGTALDCNRFGGALYGQRVLLGNLLLGTQNIAYNSEMRNRKRGNQLVRQHDAPFYLQNIILFAAHTDRWLTANTIAMFEYKWKIKLKWQCKAVTATQTSAATIIIMIRMAWPKGDETQGKSTIKITIHFFQGQA